MGASTLPHTVATLAAGQSVDGYLQGAIVVMLILALLLFLIAMLVKATKRRR